MRKEAVICIIIVFAIVLGNVITHNYTVDSVKDISEKLENLRQEAIKSPSQIEDEKIEKSISEIENSWDVRHNKLAYFIEHTEIEKVENNLTSLKSFIETKNYSDAISELDKANFLLKHIEDKYAISLENIF